MGIKFRCPECQKKIHVKSYLAGKRGLCPACGAKVMIPAESGDADDEGAMDEHASRVDLTLPADEIDPLAKTTISQGPSPVPAMLAAQAAVPQAAVPQAAIPQAAIPQAAVPMASIPVASIPMASIPQASIPADLPPADLPPAVFPQASIPTAGIPMAAVPMATVPMAAVPMTAAPAGMPPVPAAVPPIPTAAPAVAAPKATRDILAQDPDASWYVRLSSGDQFGPAKGPDMTEWLAEGRIQPDALVWREGWVDWKRAEFAFPQLREKPVAPPAAAPAATPVVATAVAATPVGVLVKRAEPKPEKPPEEDTAELLKSVGEPSAPSASSASSGGGSSYTPPPKSNAGTVAAVLGGVAVLIIAPLLAYVLMSQPGGSGGGGGILTSVTGPSWESHSGPGFTVKFPTAPRESPQSEMTPAGAFKGSRYLADHRNYSGYAFSVTSGEVLDPAAAAARLDNFCQESAMNAAKAIPGGKVSAGTPLSGLSGREYTITSEAVGDHILLRVIVAGRRRFTVSVQAMGGKSFETPIVEQFLSSFKVTDTSELPEKKRRPKNDGNKAEDSKG